MLSMDSYGEKLEELGFDFFCGVPCSFLKPMINYAINKDQFVMAANEGDAVAIAAGVTLGGRKSVFLCQNSGLTNAVSPLTSLNYTFEIPVLGFVSLRGESGVNDEPQHELMGTITDKMLDIMQIKNEVLSFNEDEAIAQLVRANEIIENGQSFFFIVRNGTFDAMQLGKQQNVASKEKNIKLSVREKVETKRLEVLTELHNIIDKKTVLLATTGVTGRELFEIGDLENQFYMVGSMGCISSVGLGLALAKPDIKIIVIDGDGSLLMRMGSLTTNGSYAPKNLYHLLLDNGLHESTGGQKTVSSIVDFVKIAEGANYDQVDQLNSLKDLNDSIHGWNRNMKLTFGYFKTTKGIKENLGRPTISPVEVKNRFMTYLKEN
ncbi:phosphonopyruvate decarboxylase [Lysinibacillus sp. NPDC093210]|uniref:phosphonopyruvate decarboxylase n=1 Tax=Lysinibacillus sp. NPDC093210 TaxID=3364133 RepID=UPI00380FBF27